LAQSPAWVRQIRVLDAKDSVAIEIQASAAIVPQTQVVTGPDRLVVDLPNAIPGAGIRKQAVNRGQVKDVRVALLQAKPPITRVVLDLKAPQSYEVIPSGHGIVVKVTGAGAPGAAAPSATPQEREVHASAAANTILAAKNNPVRASSPASPRTLASNPASVRQVRVLGLNDVVAVEIETTARIIPQTQVLSGPDRLVVDLPNAVPAPPVRDQAVNRGEVKSVRVGLFQNHPPVTRLVLDLKTPQSYQIVPYGRNLVIKVTGNTLAVPAGGDRVAGNPSTRPGLVSASFPGAAARVRAEAPLPTLEVVFRDGLLTIRANKASLSDVLFAVHQRTGAEISVAAGTEQELVAADVGPAPAPEVLARLLNGSKFNFLILSSARDPGLLDKIILSPRGEGMAVALPPIQNEDAAEEAPPVELVKANDVPPAPAPPPPPGIQTPAAPEAKAPAEDTPPQ
jgi:hypothetical protein